MATTGIPIITVPIADEQKKVTLPWYLFFNTLGGTTGSGVSSSGTVLSVNVTGQNGISVTGSPYTITGNVSLSLPTISTGQITALAAAYLGTVTALGISVTNTVTSVGLSLSGTVTAANATVTTVAAVNLSVSNTVTSLGIFVTNTVTGGGFAASRTVTALGVSVTNTVTASGVSAANTISSAGIFAVNTVSAARVALSGGTTSIVSVTVTAGTSWTMTLPTTTGTVSQVLQTDGSGNTSWSTVSSGGGGSGTNDMILIQDQKTNGTGGNGYTSGAWQTVVLNTTVTDTGSNVVSLASNQFALKAGSYEFDSNVNGGDGSNISLTAGRLRLRNITDSSTVVQGVNHTDSAGVTIAINDTSVGLSGNTIIASQKTFELQIWVTTTTTAGNALTTGDVEVYASIRLRKYA